MRSFYTDVAVRKRYPTIDDHGTSVPDWTAQPATIEITGRFQYVSTSDDQLNRISTDTVARWLGPLDIDLLITDRVEFDGAEYEPTGAPLRHRSPNGRANHSDTPLRRRNG